MRMLAALLVLTGCARATETGPASRTPGPQPAARRAILELRAERDAPIASLSFDGQTATAAPATYCWGQRCVDAFGFPPPTETVSVPAGTALELAGDATEADVSIAEPPAGEGDEPLPPGDTVQELRLNGDAETIDVPPGSYWLVVFARWEGDAPVVGGAGDASFAFGLEVTA